MGRSLLELRRALNLRRCAPRSRLNNKRKLGPPLKKRQNIHVVSAAIIREHTCLVAQRGPEMSFSGRWELPGGKVRPGEEPEEALRREVLEELDLDVDVGPMIASENSQPDERPFQVDVYEATVCSGAPHPQEHSQHRWINSEEIDGLEWVEPHQPLVPAVRAHLNREVWPDWMGLIPPPLRSQTAQAAGVAVAASAVSLSWFMTFNMAWGAMAISGLAAQRAALRGTLPSTDVDEV